MRWLLLLLIAATFTTDASALIPMPVSDELHDGEFSLSPGASVYIPDPRHDLFVDTLAKAGADVVLSEDATQSSIRFLAGDIRAVGDSIPQGEGYVLRIHPDGIQIHAVSPDGWFNGLQTLAQLVEAAPRDDHGGIALACREITDLPRFAWRGFMLDESRHFSGMEAVKRILDAMSRYKLNHFHWHLTDSSGWRIEILRYPELTRIGGRGNETDRSPDAPAQYYSQRQIRDIVAYAKDRGIKVIPEIDMPGHADAAVRAYPEHDGGGYQKWPNFTFNPTRVETLEFLDHILAEVAGLFPDAGIIHYGGDEVHFGWHKWPELTEVREFMRRENFTELTEVEAWFNRRMAGTIRELGFKTGGWDEITARGLPPEATVIWWWRHDRRDVLTKALELGYPVILTPRRPLYLDFVQHESHTTGRRWGGFNPLPDVYGFPECLSLTQDQEARVLGIQASLWTETTVTQARRDFLTWPRLIALAEAAWTPKDKKNYESFANRLPHQIDWLESNGIRPFHPFNLSPEVSDIGATPEYLDQPE